MNDILLLSCEITLYMLQNTQTSNFSQRPINTQRMNNLIYQVCSQQSTTLKDTE